MYFQKFLLEAAGTLKAHLDELSLHAVQTQLTCPRILHIVLGNEACDLDSAVSALALAFIYHKRYPQNDFVPILNIPRHDYHLKTEVGFMLAKCDISPQILLFRDDLPEQLPKEFKVILVDHHVSPYAANVVLILDHRPLAYSHEMELLPKSCKTYVEPDIGSCATLVSERYYEQPVPRNLSVTKLLHSTIILDTINFCTAAKRFSARDLAMAVKLELTLHAEQHKDTSCIRKAIFEELLAARTDITMLTLEEVLRKDVKSIKSRNLTLKIVSLPLLVSCFIEKHGAEEAINKLHKHDDLLVLLGIKVAPEDNKLVQRDLGLISVNGNSIFLKSVEDKLVMNRDPHFQFKPHKVNIEFMDGVFWVQNNLQMTRKQLMRVIQRLVMQWEMNAAQICMPTSPFWDDQNVVVGD